ncbi:peptidoglycan-binding protein [Streptomyces sp. NBC_00572]|uniref:peptidoglycan-binding domain-containing protein n=1 Tax=Streptomyces sp. NBC_00572 TaxID=2903664 RepID=UPI00224DB983|nr:peptidoglycan-binding domain-containing protein [Streptomyces sp. NBC_00572]MCX4980644.1 peptidoglycan-binding protein [Streptomyces sp. NBC_00572]
MTGHVCPECGVQRPGCACAQAELAAAEDFDPLRIRPYVTLDAAGDGGGARGPGAYATDDPYASPGAYGTDDPPTAQLAAIREDGGPVGGPGVPHEGPAGDRRYGGPGDGRYGEPGRDAVTVQEPGAGAGAGTYGTEAYGTEILPGASHPGGDPSETMPLRLHGVGDIPPPPGHERGHGRGQGRRRGMVVAAVAAVAVAGTAALAAAVLGSGDDPVDRAAVPEVTTSASLNLAVSEAPSPSSSSESPEPTSPSPTPRRTSASPSATPSASRTTTTPSASANTTGAAPPPAATASPTPATASPTTAPATTSPPTGSPGNGEEEPETLSFGSSGHEVRELQRRLTDVGVYEGRINGRYDDEVWEAVSLYQSYMYIQDDPEGVYGPNTREVLERYTPHI